MRKHYKFTVLALALIFAGTSYLAWAQHQHQEKEQKADQTAAEHSSRHQGMMHQGVMEDGRLQCGMMGDNQQQMHSMMENMEISPGMMQRHQVMMKAEIAKSDPQALLAMRDKLGLTDSQIRQLEMIVEDARNQATAVLNMDQQDQLLAMPDPPKSMQQMMMQMHEKMREMHGDQASTSCMIMCPVMQSMMDKVSSDDAGSHSAHH